MPKPDASLTTRQRRHSPSRKRRRRRRLGLTLLVIGLVACALGYRHLATREAEHARLYETGTSINTFLKGYCQAFRDAHEQGDTASLRSLYAADYEAPRRGGWNFAPQMASAGIDHFTLVANDSDPSMGGIDSALADVATYLDSIARIDRLSCRIDLIEGAEVDDSAVLTVKLVVGGMLEGDDLSDASDGGPFEDRAFQRWWLRRDGDPTLGAGWRLVDETVVDGVRVAGDGTGFERLDPAELGIDYRHRRDPKLDRFDPDSGLQFAVMGHAGGGLAVVDVDDDGWLDVFFADGVASRFYRNAGPQPDGRLHFEDVTETSGLAGLGEAHSGLFADVDGDGDLDLFVARYLVPNRLYINQGDGRFEDRAADWNVDVALPASSAVFLDYDRDGDLDLYLAAYGNAFEAIPQLPFFAENGVANRLFENVDGRRFRDVTTVSGVGDPGWSLAVAAGDVDGDGWSDLAVANDFGKKTLYRNRGDGTFEDVTRLAGVLDFSGGMGIAFGDFDGDGHADLYTSNIKSNQRWYGEDMTITHYLLNVVRSRWALLDADAYTRITTLLRGRWSGLGKQIGEGNSLFRNRGDGTFEELQDSQTNQAGWSWGVTFADLDLYAANGWISATPGTDL